jgi:hypothetical protein
MFLTTNSSHKKGDFPPCCNEMIQIILQRIFLSISLKYSKLNFNQPIKKTKIMKNPPAKPSQLITKEFAKELNLNYNKKKAASLATAKGVKKEDANAIWYSIEELENYIHYVKTQGAENGYNVDGIRFYFGAYPEDEKHGEKAGLTTLFLVPTGKKAIAATAKIETFALVQEQNSSDIQDLSPMNYGNIGRPPSLIY